LRDAAIGTNAHVIQIVDPCIFPNPGVITNAQLPGVFDAHMRLYDNAVSHASAEAAKQPNLKTAQRKCTFKKQSTDQIPKESLQRTSRFVPGIVEAF
jgi:hypothetical protein